MTKVILISTILFSTMTFAEDAKGPNFDKMKQMYLSTLDSRMAILLDEKSCANNAKAGEDLKKCHELTEQKMKDLQKKNMEAKKQMIDEQIKKLQEQKEQMQEKSK